MAFGIPEAPSIALLICIGFKCQCTHVARGKPSYLIMYKYRYFHTCFEGHPYLFKSLTIYLLQCTLILCLYWTAFCTRSASIKSLWIFTSVPHATYCFGEPVVSSRWIQVAQRMEGGWGGIAESCGRRAPPLQCSTQGCSKIPSVSGTSTRRRLLSTVHRFYLAMVYDVFFLPCF